MSRFLPPPAPMVTKRNPDRTREMLLEAAFTEIHRHGFQAASLDRILKHTGVTKGALYHHFPNKMALGYAVADELIRPKIEAVWVEPLKQAADPIDALVGLLQAYRPEQVAVACQLGCPLNNLAQEMSPHDEGFRRRLQQIFSLWRDGIAAALTRGRHQGLVRAGVDPSAVATFVVSSIEGALGMAKNSQDPAVLWSCAEVLVNYLETLRPASRVAA